MQLDPRLANRLKHSEALWERYLESPSPRQLDKWMSETLKAEKRFGSQDRRFYSDVLFAAARFVTLGLFLQKTSPRFFDLEHTPVDERAAVLNEFCLSIEDEKSLWQAIRQFSSKKAIHLAHQSVADVKALESVQQKLLSLVSSESAWTRDDLKILLIAHGIPPQWADALERRIETSRWPKEKTLAFLKMQNERPPLWIRLNKLSAREDIEKEFFERGLTLEWFGTDDCARVSGSFGVYQTDVFKSGVFEVQDWASQQIARSARAQPGQKIWDACAGGGGKTVALAASMQGRGALYASDIREFKLAEARRRCQRAGFYNLRTLAWDGQVFPKFGKEVHVQAGFDAVLVDAPCSSSGTWRRNPDARLRVGDPAGRHSLYTLQKDLIARALQQVRPQGRLIYGTCSWCVEENEDVIATLEKQLPAGSMLAERVSLLGAPEIDSDTMFAAELVFVGGRPKLGA